MQNNSELSKLIHELKVTLYRVAVAVADGTPVNPEDIVVLRGNTEQVISIAETKPAPAMFDISTVQPGSETIERNQAKVGDGDPCVVCGKKVNPNTSKWVHLSERGNAYPAGITTKEAEHFPEGSMYLFPIGPECAKKIPKGYLQ